MSKTLRIWRWHLCKTAWELWHCRLPRAFDPYARRHREAGYSHPFWHMCCNGNAGGWRTKFCNHLEAVVFGPDYELVLECEPVEDDQ